MRRTSPATERDGYALFELMLMLAIIGMIAALALPRARPFAGGAALRSKAYETAALLRADRDAARRMDREVASIVDFGTRRVNSGANRAAVIMPDEIVMRLSGDRFSGFRFFPDGRSSGGELSLRSIGGGLTLKVDRLTSAIEIRPERGPAQ